MPLSDNGVMYAAMLALTRQNIAHSGKAITLGDYNGLILSGYVIDTPVIVGEYSRAEEEEPE